MFCLNSFALTRQEVENRINQINDLRGAAWKAGINDANLAKLKERVIKDKDEETLVKLEAGSIEFEAWAQAQKVEKEEKADRKNRVKNKLNVLKNKEGLDPDVKEAIVVLVEEVLK